MKTNIEPFKKLTKEEKEQEKEAVKYLQELQEDAGNDYEDLHRKFDEEIISFLENLGFKKLTKLYEQNKKNCFHYA